MDEILLAFLGECNENLDKLDNDMIELEKNPTGHQAQNNLARIFRTVHTIKGSCGWLGLSKLEQVAHAGEDLLMGLREGRFQLRTEMVSALLEMLDAFREILNSVASQASEGDSDYTGLIQKLDWLQSDLGSLNKSQNGSGSETGTKTQKDVLQAALLGVGPPDTSAKQATLQESAAIASFSPSDNGDEALDSLLQISNSNIRVDVKLLDKLMNLVGELVLARNQILQHTNGLDDASFVATGQRLNRITSELQESVMKTRMQTIGTIWNRFPRLVRDLSLDCGKVLGLEMEGEETELDRTIVEAIKDPLTHLVRNAIDHGIESLAEREALGKPAKGMLKLQAYHEGGHVNIGISDDGRGLRPEWIREKALQKGLISPTEASQMPDRNLFNLIFLPGFSTAEKVTNVSGRGVGMDVVKNNIEKIGGLIDLYSESGQGTTIKIKIPLTLAIIPALLVTSGGERYAIPQVSLLELVCLEGRQAMSAIEMIYDTQVYRLRGNLLPLVYLNQELGLEQTVADTEEPALRIVILQADETQFGLVVDQINDTEEIVVKPLSKQLKSLSVYTGATILGDGKVALILDVMGFAQKAAVISEAQKHKLAKSQTVSQDHHQQQQSLLLFRTVDGSRMALPLSLVARLEEFEASRVEYSGDLKVIQYRNQILPLIYLADVLPRLRQVTTPDAHSEEMLHVVVYTENERSVGLVVERILDIVDAGDEAEIHQNIRRDGILGSMILQGTVTELLDLRELVRRKIPSFFEAGTVDKQLISLG